MTNIEFLLDYCKGKEELYNKIAAHLWEQFGMNGAVIILLCTYIADKFGGNSVIDDIKEIYQKSKYPEDVEEYLYDYLTEKGVKI